MVNAEQEILAAGAKGAAFDMEGGVESKDGQISFILKQNTSRWHVCLRPQSASTVTGIVTGSATGTGTWPATGGVQILARSQKKNLVQVCQKPVTKRTQKLSQWRAHVASD